MALFSVPLATSVAHADQTVDFVNITRNGVASSNPVFVVAGDTVKFDAYLTANGGANPPGTSGLGLCTEYKRAATGDPVIANILPAGLVGSGNPTPGADCTDGSAPLVPGADYMIVTAWAAFTSPGWPNVPLPVKLLDAQFTLPATPTTPARIGFGASSVAAGQAFRPGGPLVLCARPTVSLSRNSNGVEGGTPATFDVVLSTPVPAACGIGGLFQVAMTLGGTATPNGDYTISGNGISLAPGNVVVASFPADGATTSLRIVATPTADAAAEGAESLIVTLGPGTGNYAGVGATASATISDTAVGGGVVVEYIDTIDFAASPGGHFFYSSDPAEQAAVDAGAAGHFVRTGRQFLTGGSVPVCRFYGSISPGPNSHFFTADPAECAALKAVQVVPTPTTVQQWNYERDEYLTTPVTVNADGSRTCPAGTLPLYRAYNNAFPTTGGKNPWDSNHRFSPVQSDITTLVQQFGWRDEGIAYCTPAQ